MKRNILMTGLCAVLMLVVLGACSKVPQEQLTATQTAIEAAKQAASYQAQSLDDDQVRRALALDGFTPNAIAQGVPLAHRYADSPFDPLRATVWQNGSWQEVAA